ncbi:hypothetical protein [Desulfomicrobium orale]|uniref:hypothetical protein n=1 Tax=Desulfomicrobium orale TaxID=132132 RepID=UPI001F37E1CF|nr:hypothetical protein [Desulfomicrobium orale]
MSGGFFKADAPEKALALLKGLMAASDAPARQDLSNERRLILRPVLLSFRIYHPVPVISRSAICIPNTKRKTAYQQIKSHFCGQSETNDDASVAPCPKNNTPKNFPTPLDKFLHILYFELKF